MGPLLFLVYIYDLLSVPRSVPDTRLFTDDRLVYHQTDPEAERCSQVTGRSHCLKGKEGGSLNPEKCTTEITQKNQR